jgi:hypothetical protein
VTNEKWWPVEWTVPDSDVVDWMPTMSLTHWHPIVRRAMRDKQGVVLEFHHRLGRAPMELGPVSDLELRCVLLDLAAKWMRGQDNGEGE